VLTDNGITYGYTYTPNSNLVSAINETGSGYAQLYAYESNRDLLASVETKFVTDSKAKFAYTSDQLGRRTAVSKTGEVYARYGANGLDTTWGYNDRSEVTSEQTKLGGTSTLLAGRNDAYAFDNIGNRTSSTHNGNTSTYTANSLNQYTGKSNPGKVDVAGLAPAAANVTVNGSGAGVTRHNDYYFAALDVTNTTNAVWTGLTVAASTGGSTQRFSFTPPAAEVMTYDQDGNLTSDGRWDYTYDAENRLVAMQTKIPLSPGIIPNADARRVEFKNDYLGRRVQKTVRAGYNGTTYTTVQSDTKFIYDGWNLIAEYDVSSSFVRTRTYVWGLDMSRSLQGAGGVGGLLMIRDHAAGFGYQAAYDGNGNVVGMIKRATGELAAAYEYDAFGNTLRASGAYAASNPFRFSTKYTDTETGLVYYGLRYYSPTLGRFINQDPIEEQGGLNLYGFCGNNGINHWDYLGQSFFSSFFRSIGRAINSAMRGLRRFLGKIDAVIAKNNINVGSGDYITTSIPITPANPSGRPPRNGPDPFGGTIPNGIIPDGGTSGGGTVVVTGGPVIVTTPNGGGGSGPVGGTTGGGASGGGGTGGVTVTDAGTISGGSTVTGSGTITGDGTTIHSTNTRTVLVYGGLDPLHFNDARNYVAPNSELRAYVPGNVVTGTINGIGDMAKGLGALLTTNPAITIPAILDEVTSPGYLGRQIDLVELALNDPGSRGRIIYSQLLVAGILSRVAILGRAAETTAARVVTAEGGLNTSATVARQLALGGERSWIPTQSIVDTVRTGTRVADPQGVAGQFMYRSPFSFTRSGVGSTGTVTSQGTLEVLVHEPTGQIRHVLYRSGGTP
jgi:RHS repeat-associated protein